MMRVTINSSRALVVGRKVENASCRRFKASQAGPSSNAPQSTVIGRSSSLPITARKLQDSSAKRFKVSQAGQVTAASAPMIGKASQLVQTAVATRSQPLASRLWAAYTRALETRPLTTKMTAAALIFFCSDTATQKVMDPLADWDASRAVSGAVFGGFSAGYLHHWWGFLEMAVGKRITHRLLNTAVKVAIDQGAGAPLYVYLYYVVTNTLQKLASEPERKAVDILEETEARARHMLWPTMLQHWKLWPAMHSLNFYFVPLQHRVLVQNTVLVGWSGCK